jgi:hypothetical protein
MLSCKILLDREFLALQAENKLLKIRLYFMQHSCQVMVKLFRRYNLYGKFAPACVCKDCFYKYRVVHKYHKDAPEKCKFDEFMLEKCKEFGIDCVVGLQTGESVNLYDPVYGKTCTRDCHICFLSGRIDFDYFAYGTKLTKSTSLVDIDNFVKFIDFLKQ